MIDNLVNKLKETLSRIEITPIQWLISVLCIITVRVFLESLSNPSIAGIIASDVSTLIHFYVFFLVVAFVFMLILQYVLPTWKNVIPQIVLFTLPITSLPPIIDWIASMGKGYAMVYLFQTPTDMLYSFYTFFGPNLTTGITIGIRVEVAMIIIGIGALVYYVTKSFTWTFMTVLVSYSFIFSLLALPGIMSMIANVFSVVDTSPVQFIQSSILQSSTLANNIYGTLQYKTLLNMLDTGFNFLVGRIGFLILITIVGIWFSINFKSKIIAIVKNSRPERVIHYIFLILLGMIAANSQHAVLMNWNDWVVFITLLLSFYFSWMFAVCTNDIVDIEIDKISNSTRPITSGKVSVLEMKTAGYIFLFLALVGGYLSGYYAFFCVLIFNMLYYLYSIPPTRFKQIPVISAFIISLCCLSAFMAGFFTFSVVKNISALPPILIAGVVLIFFLGQHIKDLKDIEGDRVGGILTIPTIFGPVLGAKIVGIFNAVAYLLVPFIAGKWILFFGAIPAAIVSYLLAVRKPYSEKPIFYVYGLFGFFLGIVLLATL